MEQQKIKDALANQPQTFPSMIAEQLGVSEWAVVSQLSAEMMQEVSVAAFDDIMEEVTKWGEVTLLVCNDSIIAEIKGRIPPGSHGHGYFNFAHGASSIGGHIRVTNIGHICFVNKPAFGMESLSIKIFDKQGEGVFKIYLARREDKTIVAEQKEAYGKLRESLLTK